MTARRVTSNAERWEMFSRPPFTLLSDAEQAALARNMRVVPFVADEIIYVQGQDVSSIAFVSEGQIKMCATAAQGKECVLHIIRPYAFIDIGVIFYVGAVPYSAVALTPGKLCVIEKEAFLGVLKANFGFCSRCMRILTARQRLFINKIVGSQGRISVACRVSAWLLHRCRMEQSDELHFDMGRELMARLLGVTRESLSRELSRLAEHGYITVDRRCIVLLDKRSLKLIARS